jgi:hypothetical protein
MYLVHSLLSTFNTPFPLPANSINSRRKVAVKVVREILIINYNTQELK